MTKPLQLSANISMLFKELPLMDRFTAAAQAGFPAVEIQFPRGNDTKELSARASDNGLFFNHLNTHPGNEGEVGLAAQAGREDEFAFVMDEALTYARDLDARTIHVMSGMVAPDDRARAKDTFIANMHRASTMAEGMNVALCIEPINAVDRAGYFVSASDEVVELLEEIDRPNVKLLFDFYHIQIMEGDLLRRMDRHWPHIGHFQFAGVPERNEPDNAEINYKRIFSAIAERDWPGWVGAEYIPRGETQVGLGWMKTLVPR